MKRFIPLLLGAAALGACGGKPVAECSAESAQAPVISIVQSQIEKSIQRQVRGQEGASSVSLSKIRAALGQVAISMADIRTSKEDPSSTKRFCVGTVKVRIPAEMLDDAEATREAVDLPSVSELAENSSVERNADTFSTEIEFNVQPTDDGSKIFAETESGNNIFDLVGEVVASGLLKSAVAEAQRQSRLSEERVAAAENAAQQESRAASLELAKSDNQIAVQTINAAWSAIGADRRKQYLQSQRAWGRKKDADCRLEAAQSSTDPTEIEIARLGCDTRTTNERTGWLQQMRASQPDYGYASPMPESGPDTEDDF